MDSNDLENRFSYHPPKNEETARHHELVRYTILSCAKRINHLVPDGREASLSITKLEEAMYWANAGIARIGISE